MNEKRYKEKALKRLLSYCKRDDNGCLIFTGAKGGKGYGRFVFNRKLVQVNRLIMHLLHEFDLDSPLQVLHKNFICKSKACIDDTHLYIGTAKKNSSDSLEMGWKPFGNTQGQHNREKTHCGICNLELIGDNLRIKGKERVCRNCDRRRNNEAYQRRKLEKETNKINQNTIV